MAYCKAAYLLRLSVILLKSSNICWLTLSRLKYLAVTRNFSSNKTSFSLSIPSFFRALMLIIGTCSFSSNLAKSYLIPLRSATSSMFNTKTIGTFKSATWVNNNKLRFKLLASAINTTKSG